MKILLIWAKAPGIAFDGYGTRKTVLRLISSKLLLFPWPLNLPILSALTPEKHSVEIIEASPRDINFDEKYDIVGITFTTQCSQWAYEMADDFRKRGTFVVLGGWHASALPEEAKQHADVVFIGEAEETWPQFISDFEMKKTKPFYIPTRAVDVSSIPSLKNYLSKEKAMLGVQATRGCPYGCEFCSITNTKFQNIFRVRPIKEVIEEINSLPTKSFNFHDNSLTINPNYTKELFRNMIGLNKKFYGFGNSDVLGSDEELLNLAAEAGCVGWLIGFESVSQQSIDGIGKKTNLVNDYISSVKKIHNYGMIVLGSFVFGFDNDTLDIFDSTDEFVRKSEMGIPDAQILAPYPGTPLFYRLEKEGRILTKDWLRYDFQTVVFRPKNMTPEELYFNTRDLYKKWYKASNSMRRIIRSINFGFTPFVQTAYQSLYMKILRYYD
jgi:radical SAM superfamily enzyme YgiQ (UPF0313 family)